MHVWQFSGKTKSFHFFSPNLPKSGFRVANSESYCRNKNQHPRYTMFANVQSKWTTSNFSAQICPKKDLGLETEKNWNEKNVVIRINIVETLCVPIFSQTGQLWLFWPKFAQKWILGLKFQKSKSGFRISILEILCAAIFRQNGQLWIFGPKFAQKWVSGSEYQNLTLDSESTPPKYQVCQFSVKMDNF